jgi:hypothetical protein
LDAQQTGALGGHDEGVRAPAWREREPARADEVLGALDVEQNFSFDDVERLVDVGVEVHRGHLAALEVVFEHQHRVVGLLRQRLPDVESSAEEPPALAVVFVPHDRLAHRRPPLSVVVLESHNGL